MEILNKIKQPESRKLEFKEKFPEKSKILKTIIAFSNGTGGEGETLRKGDFVRCYENTGS